MSLEVGFTPAGWLVRLIGQVVPIMLNIQLTIGYFSNAGTGWLGQCRANKQIVCSFSLAYLSHLSRYVLIAGLASYESAQLKHISIMLDFGGLHILWATMCGLVGSARRLICDG